jgi:molecular chaperone GrpE
MDAWPDQEELLHRFRDWLDQTRTASAALEGEPPDDELKGEPIGLLQLVEQLTALRHDVKLLTKAARSDEERHEATLLSMQAAIEQFRLVEPEREESAAKAARPLVEALVELDESLTRGRRVIEQARGQLQQQLHAELTEARDRLDQLYNMQPRWRRRLCRAWHEATRDVYSARTIQSARSMFDSLLEGYDLIQNRLSRTMDEQSIVRIQCVGSLADPNRMTVLETLSDPSRPPGTVIAEIRPGYSWRGKVFRFAEVTAVAQK